MASTFLPLAGAYSVWPHPVDPKRLATRPLGRTGREVTTFGLAGGNKVMWDLPGGEGVEIIVKAVRSGITYLETANNYQLSQRNFHKAFRIPNLIPGEQGYDHNLRGRLFLATKTGLRYAAIRDDSKPMGRSAGNGKTCIEDLMRSLTQFFGDGKGYIPEGAYIDLMQIHFLSQEAEVEAIYEGLDSPSDRSRPRIGALAGLLDFRDGTNHTGLNPSQKKYIRHIGITGHENAAAHMAAIRRDTRNIIDTLLVAINPNDRHCFCHQTNSVPVAASKGMGIIGMKVFADGVMYGLEKKYASQPGQSVLSVGQKGKVSYQDFLRYTLSAEGVSTVIAGIGLIDRSGDARRDQLIANLEACQVRENLPAVKRKEIENQVAQLHGTDTNFFQRPACGIIAPQGVKVDRAGSGPVRVTWHTAYAAGEPLIRYEVYRREQKMASMSWKPQISEAPLEVTDAEAPQGHSGGLWYKVRVVDASGAFADSLSVKPA